MKKMRDVRVLLVSPNVLGLKDGINRIQPGLGIMYIAAVLEQRGCEVAIYDSALEGYERQVEVPGRPNIVEIGDTDEAIVRRIMTFKPDMVGISVLFYNQSPQAYHLAKLVKGFDDTIPVVVGGNQVAEEYSGLMQNENFDFAMITESDLNFADFVERYFSGGDFHAVPGLVYRKGDALAVNPAGGIVKNLNELPFPARHLVNMEKYFQISMFHNPYSRHPRVGNVMTSRGCPEKCTFCTTPLRWGKNIRWRSAENVYQEILQLKEQYGVGEIQFEDDSLTLNIKNLFTLCDLIGPLGLSWNTVNGIRADYHGGQKGKQERMFRKMAEAGCYQVCLGVETGNQDLLDNLLNKHLDLHAVEPCVTAAKKAGLAVHLFLMVGFPGETIEQMHNTIRFAEGLDVDSCSISIYSPLPGTRLYDYAVSNNYLVDGFSKDNILFAKANIKVPGMTSEEFEEQVVKWTNRLNNRLKEKSPAQYREKYAKFLNEDNTFLFRKHS
ncbi:MAG: B12-binding domain-containing radical SAM protein [Proteobacteria bacterium]|nr:B12-binding domain-containing radical SAM protein [Pseudomonadota bacterium]MBU4296694.1 B12-binding domain-containing radical SAM protein [Pseudomonadota bacterium]MCG2748487.1 B12-binding domain-containing radical SAM protein [Desulfobulbaceae bacterium]